MVRALLSEMELRADYLGPATIETIYFGGGTPSLLPVEEIGSLIDGIRSIFKVAAGAELTLEANPDDITNERLDEWKSLGVNRLSIGLQSFFDEDLQWMNRSHSAHQAMSSVQSATKKFDNITADLIYGYPSLTDEKWKANVERVLSYGVPHLSCYALTVEPKTALDKKIRENRSSPIDPETQSRQFMLLMDWMDQAGYEHYEISNFAKPGFRSRHNSSYWSAERKPYLGIGPAAHSFDGQNRQWNVANNAQYISSLEIGIVPFEKETLTPAQKANEYIMTSLRTLEGLNLQLLDEKYRLCISTISRKFIDRGLMFQEADRLKLTKEGRLLADGIAAELFVEYDNSTI